MTLFEVPDAVSGLTTSGAFLSVASPVLADRLLWSSLSVAVDTVFLSPDDLAIFSSPSERQLAVEDIFSHLHLSGGRNLIFLLLFLLL